MSFVTTAIDFFGADELECKGSRKKGPDGKGIPGTGVIRLDPKFAVELPKLRRAWGKPLSANSICRTPAHNAATKGANPNSLHMTVNAKWKCATMAADINWRGWSQENQLAFAKLALSMGWRVGLHDGFCHIDRLLDIAPNYKKVFLYGTYTGALVSRL